MILVVEDEEHLARLLVEALTSAGHRVETAGNGKDALERIERREFDVIISDLRMPSMDGRRLFEHVRGARPDLARRMIFSTGDVASVATRAFLSETDVPILLKPFKVEDALRTVAELLEREG